MKEKKKRKRKKPQNERDEQNKKKKGKEKNGKNNKILIEHKLRGEYSLNKRSIKRKIIREYSLVIIKWRINSDS